MHTGIISLLGDMFADVATTFIYLLIVVGWANTFLSAQDKKLPCRTVLFSLGATLGTVVLTLSDDIFALIGLEVGIYSYIILTLNLKEKNPCHDTLKQLVYQLLSTLILGFLVYYQWQLSFPVIMLAFTKIGFFPNFTFQKAFANNDNREMAFFLFVTFIPASVLCLSQLFSELVLTNWQVSVLWICALLTLGSGYYETFYEQLILQRFSSLYKSLLGYQLVITVLYINYLSADNASSAILSAQVIIFKYCLPFILMLMLFVKNIHGSENLLKSYRGIVRHKFRLSSFVIQLILFLSHFTIWLIPALILQLVGGAEIIWGLTDNNFIRFIIFFFILYPSIKLTIEFFSHVCSKRQSQILELSKVSNQIRKKIVVFLCLMFIPFMSFF